MRLCAEVELSLPCHKTGSTWRLWRGRPLMLPQTLPAREWDRNRTSGASLQMLATLGRRTCLCSRATA